MIKKSLIATLLIIAIGFGFLKILSNAVKMEWGHHFNFENELGIDIDSLEITVGEVKTIIQARFDSLRTLEGNINVPQKGYPHKVIFKIYSSEKSMILEADSFNCYNGDGSHEYKLKESGAEYKFLN
ncbi:MAG: hypothetical protein COA58_15915 [Bacteroidetes bacterium]|nr:MAG: hypothetical protein COA58_15915 [Bacteroidota bacterium]